MRRYFLPLMLLSLIFGTSCQPKVNIEEEKEAILAVIQEEADGFMSMDKDKVFATHLQGSEEVRMELGVYGYRVYEGWDDIESLLGDFLDSESEGNVKISKENVTIKVAGTGALFTCDNVVQWSTGDDIDGYTNLQVVFLEKVMGDWKISFAAYYNKPVEVPGIDESFSGPGGL